VREVSGVGWSRRSKESRMWGRGGGRGDLKPAEKALNLKGKGEVMMVVSDSGDMAGTANVCSSKHRAGANTGCQLRRESVNRAKPCSLAWGRSRGV
jgi:hypothetical protein